MCMTPRPPIIILRYLVPVFSRDQNGLGTNVFISGYLYVSGVSGPSDPNFVSPIDIDDLAATNVQVVNLPVNVYGISWIIGAKKGFPNFNELAMDSAFQLTRKLLITRSSPAAMPSTYSNYQMFILNITNQIGVECWNSYTNSYPNPVTIYAVDSLRNIVLTNLTQVLAPVRALTFLESSPYLFGKVTILANPTPRSKFRWIPALRS